MGPAAGTMAWWESLLFPVGSGSVLQPIMGPTAGPMACWTCLFFPIGAVFLQPAMGPAAGPMACWTGLLFPLGERFNPPAHYGSSSWANGLLDELVLPKLVAA